MKTIDRQIIKKIVFVFFSCILYLACDKNIDPPAQPWPFWGNTTAERNGEPWSSEVYAKHLVNPDNQLFISMDSLLGSNLETLFETLTFSYVKKGVGKHSLTSDTALAGDSLVRVKLTTWDSDVIIGSYNVVTSDPESFLEIEYIDTVTNIIKGRFGATLVVTKRPFPFYPDTIRYRNGRFETKIIN